MKATIIALSVLALTACDGGGTNPTPTTTSIPSIQISGSVTSYRFDLVSAGSQFGNISYIVTNRSNRAVVGCFVRVNWIDASGLQVDFTFAATDIAIPAGLSTITNQDFMEARQAARITQSRVEYSNCR